MPISFGCLMVGFILSQVGIFFGNRWGRTPRPDEKITQSLKGLEDKYVLYHYTTAVPHLLVGPAGVWALIPYPVKGTITYDEKKGRWNHKGGNIYMKLFAQEGIGRPDMDAQSYLEDTRKYLIKQVGSAELPQIQTAFVFIHPNITINAQNAPIPTLPVDKLKDFIRRKAKEDRVAIDMINLIQKALPE
jgi:hypothetical protein